MKSGGVGDAATPIRDSIMAATNALFCTEDRLQKICNELDLLAFSDVTDYLILGENGSVIWKDPENLKASGLTRAIKKIKRRKIYKAGKEDEDDVITDEIDFELHDKNRAIEMHVEIMGIKAPQKQEHKFEGPVTFKVIYEDKPGNGNGV